MALNTGISSLCFFLLTDTSTFIGIAVHNATATGAESSSIDLAAGVRQDASGLLGTTLQLSDLVSRNFNLPLLCKMEGTRHDADLLMARSSLSPICFPTPVVQVIPFVAGGFLYIGAVAVLPT